MELFIILLALSILLFLGSFIFVKVDTIFLILSALTIILTGVGMWSHDVTITTNSELIYNYDNLSSPNPILLSESTQLTYLYESNPNFHRYISFVFVLFGMYLFFVSSIEVHSRNKK